MNKISKEINNKTRKKLRIIGSLLLIIGLTLVIIGTVATFAYNNTSLFFLCFIGLPLIPCGFVCVMYSLIGKIQRYIINETAENTADATNYILKESKDNIKDITKDKEVKRCPNCNDIIEDGELYCDKCGTKLTRTCPNCGEEITNTNSLYCPNCGEKL